jgi:uncharacterized membrane protein (DUF485 family)
MSGLMNSLRELRRYPSAVFGLVIILLLVIIFIVVFIIILILITFNFRCLMTRLRVRISLAIEDWPVGLNVLGWTCCFRTRAYATSRHIKVLELQLFDSCL